MADKKVDPFTGRTIYGPDHEMNQQIRKAAKRGETVVQINPKWGQPKEKPDGKKP